MAISLRKTFRSRLTMVVLECRIVPTFSNWSSIGPAIAGVPGTAGQMSNVSVVNFGTTVYTGPLNVDNTLDRIRANGTPLDSNDGSVYHNNNGLLPNGSWFEFVVAPSNGTDHNFSFSSPGPMRILLDTQSDVYFTGNHYSSFTLVYQHNLVPTIGSFTLNPTSVTSGSSTTLTASSVTESGGSISSVKFYRESNGTSGLQTGGDTLLGTGSQSGTTWTFATATTGFAAGTYTYYSVATDAFGTNSTTSTANLTVTSGAPTPVIGSFTLSPVTVNVGGSTTLTASNVTESGGSIASVKFYRESNSTTGLQIGSDTLLGTGAQSGTTWTLTTSTTGLTAGNYTYYALATDAASATTTANTTLAVTNPAANGVALAWDVNGQTTFGTQNLTATQVASGLTNTTGLTRGSGVTTTNTAANNAWGGNNWDAITGANGITDSAFVTFGMTVGAGHTLSLSSVDLFYRHSGSGAPNGLWQYQLNTGSWVNIADVTSEFSSTSTSGAAIAQLGLASITALQNVAAGTAVNFRLVPYGASDPGGTWYVYDQTGNDLVVSGSVANTPPVIGHDSASATVNEGATANNTGTFSDSLGNGSVTIATSVGIVVQNNAQGTWSWSYATQDGPANSQTVTLTATNSLGATATTTFPLTVNNVAPTGIANLPTVALPNAQVSASITNVSDLSSIDAGAGFKYSFDWTNDGTFDVLQSSNNSANYSYVTPGNYTVRMRVEDKDGGTTDYLKPITVANPPTVTSVVFGDGTNQRSMVKQIVVTFSEAVNFTPDVASSMTVNRTGTGGTQGEVTLSATPASGPASVVTITFFGTLSENGSLADGFYDFTIGAAQVTGVAGALDGNNDGIPGGSYYVNGNTTNKFFRLFGDADGDATTTLTDFAAFREVFNLGANATFDFDNNSNVDLGDFAQFRGRFNLSP